MGIEASTVVHQAAMTLAKVMTGHVHDDLGLWSRMLTGGTGIVATELLAIIVAPAADQPALPPSHRDRCPLAQTLLPASLA